MTDTPNVFTTFRGGETCEAPIETGDVAIVLKKDGRVQALNFGYDRSRLHLPVELQTEEDRAMQLQGEKLFALCLAASTPQIMDLLIAIASDPEVVDFEKLAQLSRVH